MAITKTRTLEYIFGDKHRDYMRRCRSSTINVAEGAVRAGKTVDNVFAFAFELENTPDKIHLATGSTAGNAKLNIGDCNGFGLEGIFRGRCRWGKYKDNDCLKIKTGTGVKIVIFAGGKNADSYKKIRGNSYGMWIATEINLHHDSTIHEAFNRQLAAKRRKIFWDLNPDNPNAPIYTDYIDKYAKQQSEGKLPKDYYNYEHFTIRDNATVSEERFREIEAQYDKSTVWYLRDILGQRRAAEGLVYRAYADAPEKYVCEFGKTDDSTSGIRRFSSSDIEFINIGVDFGGNRSLTTFVATAFIRGQSGLYTLVIVADHHITGQKGEIDADRVNRELIAFVQQLGEAFPGVYIKYAFCDNEAQYLVNGLRKACKSAALSVTVQDAAKNLITQRIYCATTLLATGRMYICRDCRLVSGGLSNAVWDVSKQKDTRLDNFSSDIDILDAFEYSWEKYMKTLVPDIGRGKMEGI